MGAYFGGLHNENYGVKRPGALKLAQAPHTDHLDGDAGNGAEDHEPLAEALEPYVVVIEEIDVFVEDGPVFDHD